MNVRSVGLPSSANRQLATLSVGWLLYQLGRQLFPPLLPTIIQEFTISAAQAGVALTVLWLVYSLLHYPGGRLADRLSRKTVLVVGLGIGAAGFLLLAGSVTFGTLLVAAAIIGGGGGLFFMAMRVSLYRTFDDRSGRAFGVNMAAGNVGAILAAALAATVLVGDSWRFVFVPVAAGLLVVLLALHLDLAEPYRVSRVSFGLRSTVAGVVGSSRVRWLLVTYCLFVFAYRGVLVFLPTFLEVGRGYSAIVAAVGFAIPYAIGLVVTPVAGGLSDRLPPVYVIAGAPILGTVGILGMVAGASAAVVLFWTAVFATGLMSFPPAMQSHVMARFADSSMGGDFGAFKTVYTGVASLGPTYVGLVATRSYSLAFGSLAAFTLAAAGLAYVLLRDAG